MLFDVVQEVRAQAETVASSRIKKVERDVDCLKRGLNGLSDDADKRLGKLEQNALVPVPDAAGCVKTLKQWVWKASATIVYDSTVDEFTHDGLFNKVKGKQNIAIVATTTDGDVFGGFYSVAVTKQNWGFKDLNMFAFSFESRGRCMTPQRFALQEGYKDGSRVTFFKNACYRWFVMFETNTGSFPLGNEKSITYCVNVSWAFEGIENTTLTGKDRGSFYCCRLIAIHLE